MNTQFNNSGDRSGSGELIPIKEVNRLLPVLAKTRDKAMQTYRHLQERRAESDKRDILFWSWNANGVTPIKRPSKEMSPASAYLYELAQTETTILQPQQTGEIDISLEATHVEDKNTFKWNPYDLLAEKLQQKELSPVTSARMPRITVQLEGGNLQILHFVNGDLSAQELIETAIGEYARQYDMLPTRVRISPSTLLRIDGRSYWTQGERTYYRSNLYGPCPVEIDITLDHMTVQCEEAELTH